MQKVISIWKNTSQNGNVYFTGKLGELPIIGFEAKEKENPKAPDITFYVREEKEKPKETKKDETTVRVEDIFADFGEAVSVENNMLD